MKIYEYNGKKNICGQRVCEARKCKKYTQSEFAAKLQTEGVNIERDSISKLESGRRFVADYELLAISKILQVPVIWLLGDDSQ